MQLFVQIKHIFCRTPFMCPRLPSWHAKTDQILLKSINLEKWQVRSLLLTTAMWQWHSSHLHLCLLSWHPHRTRLFGLTHAAVSWTALQTDSNIKFVLDFTGWYILVLFRCVFQVYKCDVKENEQKCAVAMAQGPWRYGPVAMGRKFVESVRKTPVNVLSVSRVRTIDLRHKCQFGSDNSAIFWRVLTTSSQNWTGKCYYKVE